ARAGFADGLGLAPSAASRAPAPGVSAGSCAAAARVSKRSAPARRTRSLAEVPLGVVALVERVIRSSLAEKMRRSERRLHVGRVWYQRSPRPTYCTPAIAV